ncbi:hypothetical protein [Magnetospirillum sp. LM-5]|nr:hypothetical protein [Magnetospirillum sp. LM-5]
MKVPSRWVVPLAVVWVVAVQAAYFVYSAGYYREKIGVFGRFLFGP